MKKKPTYKELEQKIHQLENQVKTLNGASREIKTEESFLGQLFESVREAIVMCDNYGKVIQVNSSFTKLFKYTNKDAVGQILDDLIAKKGSRSEAVDITKRVTSGETVEFEGHRYAKDGIAIYVLAYTSPIIIDNQQKGVYAIYRDITTEKQFEKELETEKSYLGQLFEGAQEAIVMGDNYGRILQVNNKFTKLFQYTNDESEGKSIDELIAPDPQMKKAVRITKRVTKGETFEFEAPRKKKDGTLVEVSIFISPIIVGQKQVGVYATYRDISKTKHAERPWKQKDLT